MVRDEAQSGVGPNGRLVHRGHLNVGITRALASRPVSEFRDHRGRQTLLTMIRTGPDAVQSEPVSAPMSTGNGNELRMIFRSLAGYRTMAGSAEFGRLC